MADPQRPLPTLNEHDSHAFWQATKNKELKFQRCANCQTLVFFPRSHCTGCTDGDLTWHTASGLGTVYSYSVVRQSYHPFFRSKAPYVVAWIDLDEGPRLLSNVEVSDPAEVSVGQRVQVHWEEHDELCIPLFAPVR
ncbi:MAG: OB-fold domain-containing protein [Proteobacteria bacterium]|nr:OB-fold domain-containing protein [Pseudomonadota bacterium]